MAAAAAKDDRQAYRPRRALIEPEAAEPGSPEEPAASEPSGSAGPATPAPTVIQPAVPSSGPVRRDLPVLLDDEDEPKPLYRDEVYGDRVYGDGVYGDGAAAGSSDRHAARGASAIQHSSRTQPSLQPEPVAAAALDSTAALPAAGRPPTFSPRRPPTFEEDDATTVLPRTTGRGGHSVPNDEFDEDEPHSRLGRRGKLALVISAVAAVVVVGIALMYSVAGVGNRSGAVSVPPTSAGASNSTSSSPAGPLLSDASMMTPANAKLIDGARTWQVANTETTGATPPTAACLSAEPVDGLPTPAQQLARLLTSSGKNAPTVLHQATAYATPEEAVQAYVVTAKALGTCSVAGTYLASGQVVAGLGDQAVGVQADVVNGSAAQTHTMILNRTGRVLNLVDVTSPAPGAKPAAVAKAAAAVTGTQCGPAAGRCADAVSVTNAPPPMGGDEPGFLTPGDLPPAGQNPVVWAGTPVEQPDETFLGSQCETVDWATLPARAKGSRIYLLADTAGDFGLNEIVVTLKDSSTASKLVSKIKSDLDGCAKRKLTATVSTPAQVSSLGADKSAVTGYTATVSQRSTKGVQRYRVGIVAAGSKVAYTFLNPGAGYDFTDSQWTTVALRAGERASQVS